MNTKGQISEDRGKQIFLKENYHRMTLKAMASALDVSMTTVSSWAKHYGLTAKNFESKYLSKEEKKPIQRPAAVYSNKNWWEDEED